jgi:predicted RNase H-like HicB family nuclease
MKTYTAVCEPGERWWAIRVPGVRGVYSQARRLDRVEYMARDAIALMLEVPEDSFRVVVKPDLGSELDAAVSRARKARERADRAQREAAEAATVAVTSLLALGLSMREAGQILGLSHQRVAQIAAAGKQPEGEAAGASSTTEDRSRTGRPAEPAAYPPVASRRRSARRVAER